MCAFNISLSSITDSLKLTSINEHTLQGLISNSDSSSVYSSETTCADHPLRHCTKSIRRTTGVSAVKLIKPAYNDLIEILDENLYSKKL